MTADTWFVNRLSVDTIIRFALYKRIDDAEIDGVRCILGVICPNNVIEYLSIRALASAPLEVRAAGRKILEDAQKRDALYHEDEFVSEYAHEVFRDVDKVAYTDEHIRQARELLASELRRCVVCVTDVFTAFEKFIQCVEVSGDGYLFLIRRPGGAIHVYSNLANALDEINRRLIALYRVAIDDDVDIPTFETLVKIYAKIHC